MLEQEQISNPPSETTTSTTLNTQNTLDSEADNINYKFMLMMSSSSSTSTTKMTSITSASLTANPEQIELGKNLLSPQISLLSTQSSPHSSISTTVNKAKLLYNGRTTPSNAAESAVSYCPFFEPHYWRYVLF